MPGTPGRRRHLTGFRRTPVPPGPRGYRAGAWLLKATCWLLLVLLGLAAVGLVAGGLVLATVFQEVGASKSSGLGIVFLLAFVLAFLLLSLLALLVGAGLLAAANGAYLRWAARDEGALRWARATALLVALPGAVGVAALRAEVQPLGVLVLFAPLAVVAVPLLLATLAPSLRRELRGDGGSPEP